jgi:hypothetical protein
MSETHDQVPDQVSSGAEPNAAAFAATPDSDVILSWVGALDDACRALESRDPFRFRRAARKAQRLYPNFKDILMRLNDEEDGLSNVRILVFEALERWDAMTDDAQNWLQQIAQEADDCRKHRKVRHTYGTQKSETGRNVRLTAKGKAPWKKTNPQN